MQKNLIEVEVSESYPQWPTQRQGYELISPIGLGNLGLVWKAKCTETHFSQPIAIKIIETQHLADENVEEIRKEIMFVSECRHPNIVGLYTSFLDGSDIWLVMPFIENGDLSSLLKNHFANGIKQEFVIASILKDAISALAYLHDKCCLHRDIKAEKILVDKNGRAYFSAFGICNNIQNQRRHTFAGTAQFMAPEVILQKELGYDYKIDIWSMGITALEISDGHAPNSHLSNINTLMQVINYPSPELNKYATWSQWFTNLISDCLHKDPNFRPSCKGLLAKHHEFFKQAQINTSQIQEIFNNIELGKIDENLEELGQ